MHKILMLLFFILDFGLENDLLFFFRNSRTDTAAITAFSLFFAAVFFLFIFSPFTHLKGITLDLFKACEFWSLLLGCVRKLKVKSILWYMSQRSPNLCLREWKWMTSRHSLTFCSDACSTVFLETCWWNIRWHQHEALQVVTGDEIISHYISGTLEHYLNEAFLLSFFCSGVLVL